MLLCEFTAENVKNFFKLKTLAKRTEGSTLAVLFDLAKRDEVLQVAEPNIEHYEEVP